MKTTLYLDPELIRAAKKQALKNGISLTKLIEFAITRLHWMRQTP